MRRAGAEIEGAAALSVVVVVMVVPVMVVPMGVVMPMVAVTVHPDFAFAAAADGTHHSTSKSLIRIWSPSVTCNRYPPQRGQGS